MRRIFYSTEAAHQVLGETAPYSQKQHPEKEVRGHSKHRAGFSHAAQVDQHHEQYQPNRQWYPIGKKGRIGRGNLGYARSDRDGHGEDIVGQQRRPGNLSGEFSQVVTGDDIGSTTTRVSMDGL